MLIIRTGKSLHNKFSVSETPGLQRETMTLNDIENSALQPSVTKGRCCWILKGSCSVSFKSQGVASKLRIATLLWLPLSSFVAKGGNDFHPLSCIAWLTLFVRPAYNYSSTWLSGNLKQGEPFFSVLFHKLHGFFPVDLKHVRKCTYVITVLTRSPEYDL